MPHLSASAWHGPAYCLPSADAADIEGTLFHVPRTVFIQGQICANRHQVKTTLQSEPVLKVLASNK